MAITSLIVKIGAKDQEIQNALADVGKKAKSLDADLSQLGSTPIGKAAQQSLEAMKATMKSVEEAQKGLADKALNVARGLEAVGGVTKVTGAELNSLGREVAKGVDAFKALGKEAPDELTRVHNAILSQQTAIKSTAATWDTFVKGFNIQDAISNPMGTAKNAILAMSESMGGMALAATAGVAAFAAIGTAAYKLATNAAAVGSSLDDMADKTGMSVPALSRLQNAAAVAGTNLGTLTDAVFKVEQRMGEGGAKWDAALKKMGLSTEALRDAGPDQLLETLAAGLSQIQDPAERAAVGVQLMGKGAKDVIPVLADLSAALALTNDISPWTAQQAKDAEAFEMQISSLVVHVEAFGTAIGRWLIGPIGTFIDIGQSLWSVLGKADDALLGIGRTVRALGSAWEFGAAAIRKFRGEAEKLPAVTGDAAKGLAKWHASVASMTATVPDLNAALIEEEFASKALAAEYSTLTKAQAASDAAHRASAEAVRKAADQHRQFTESVRDLTSSAIGAAKGFGAFGQLMPDLSSRAADAMAQMRLLSASVLDVSKQIGILPNVVPQATKSLEDAAKAAASFGTTLKTNLSKSLSGLNHVFQSAFEGGGGVKGALQSFTTNALQGVLGAIPAIGPIVSQFAGAIVAGFKKIFGGSAEKAINPIREAFVQAAGGLAALNARAVEAGVTLKAMLDAKTPEQYKKAIDNLSAALKFQDDAMATLKETTERYGFTLEELGPALQRQELGKQAEGIFRDWSILNAAGISTIAIAGRMAESINAYVKQAVAMGVEVPASMRPMLQTMIDQGLLTDAAGNKITDLNDAGLTFAQTMSEGFKSVVDEVKKLAEAISGRLGTAIANIPTNIDVGVNLNARWNIPDMPHDFAATGGLVTAHGIQNFAVGGKVLPFRRHGSDSVPAMLTPGEIILNEAQQGNVAAAMSGGGVNNTAAIVAAIERGNAATERREAMAEQRNARMVRDAVQKVVRR